MIISSAAVKDARKALASAAQLTDGDLDSLRTVKVLTKAVLESLGVVPEKHVISMKLSDAAKRDLVGFVVACMNEGESYASQEYAWRSGNNLIDSMSDEDRLQAAILVITNTFFVRPDRELPTDWTWEMVHELMASDDEWRKFTDG